MNKKHAIILSIFSLLLLVVLLSTSYALITKTVSGQKNYSITVGDLDFTIENESNGVSLQDAYPMTDYQGKKLSPYTFTIRNTGSDKLTYNLKLVEDKTDSSLTYLTNDKVKFYLVTSSMVVGPKLLSETIDNVLYNGLIDADSTESFELRLWLDYGATLDEAGKVFKAKIEITATQYVPAYTDNSGANEPNLASNMIPVTYDGTNWVKADIINEKWYDYDQEWWANAVTVSDTNRSTYQNATAGTVISMNDINTMFVWIPRYEYENITSTTATEIKVNFLSGKSTTASSNCIVHPAFTFGNEELTGIWVAKFEASSDAACTAGNGSIGTGCDITALNVIVKPNVTSWRGIRTSTAFTVTRNMESTNNIYGFVADEVDTHMMKNTEWGAVTYLSQSKYGKYGNTDYIENSKEIYQNKSSEYITGMSNGTPGSSTANAQVAYTINGAGTGASTTGNIYGIYDMSGGAWEYVMGVIQDNTNTNTPMSGNSTTYNSGFTGKVYASGSFTLVSGVVFSESKYYDLYAYGTTYNDTTAYARSIKGDATTETKGWYDDTANFASASNSWFTRGGGYDSKTSSGVFHFNSSDGAAGIGGGFRSIVVK